MESVSHADLRVHRPGGLFPQTTTILHRLNIWWDILRMACISSASPSSRNGESCTAGRSAHIPVRRSSGSTAVLWSFLLLQNSRHKQVPVPIRPSPFLAGQVSSARRFSKKKHPQSIPLCGCLVDIWILFFSFQMSARHPATVVLCFPLLPQLPVQCGHGRFPAYNTHRSLQCRLPETPTLSPQGW